MPDVMLAVPSVAVWPANPKTRACTLDSLYLNSSGTNAKADG
ncbi:hypothetical protein C7476_1448 [Phyllobacterium bourgognense]|uniref:Uncharacterized protein n=1 Tax=Phyllobacterium bourgognense TaxID=314236 RepID=A0A368YBG7_9HYPH|nr:hypothetical protein C7476_1448 [Phyllobacterium bourgognense]